MKKPINQLVGKITAPIPIFVFLLLTLISHAQDAVIRGMVSDERGKPLAGVTVKKEGSKYATITRNDGTFEFSVTEGAPILTFFKDGYSSVRVKAENNINITLVQQKESIFTPLDSLTNYGFFNWSRNNTSLSTSIVEPEYYERSELSVADFLEKVPGVLIDEYTGLPGDMFSAIIRGAGSVYSRNPLYVVDGIIQNAGINLPESFSSDNPLLSINVKDIEKVTVLKSAAATAIYGSRGANGVVLIDTKRGKNQPLRITYHGQAGGHFRVNQPEMLPADDYFELLNESLDAAGREMISFVGAFEHKNWLNRSLQTGLVTDHTLSLRGGGERSLYYLSGNYLFNRGIMQGTGINAGRLRFNHSTQIARWLDFQFHFGYGQSGRRNRIYDGNALTEDPLVYAAVYPPVGRNDVSRFPELYNRFGAVSPEEFLDDQIAENTGSQFTGGVSLNIRFTRNLSFQTKATGDYNDFGKEWRRYLMKDRFVYSGNTLQKLQTGNMYNWHVYNSLNFEKLHGNSHWVFLLGLDQNYFKSKATVNYFLSGQSEEAELFYKGNNSVRTNALFTKLAYAWNNKMDVSLSFRREQLLRQEGSELFGLFPSFAAGFWIFKQEEEERTFFSGAKLEVGWGIPGAENFRFMNYSVTAGNPNRILSATITPDEQIQNSYHPNVMWEFVEEWNVGVLTQWFGADLSVSLDYFDRLRENVAFREKLSGNRYDYKWHHSARIYHSGLDVQADYKKDLGNIGITGGLYMQFGKPKVLSLGEEFTADKVEGFQNITMVPVTVLKLNEEPGAFWGYKKIGIFQSDQEVRFANAIDGNPDTYYQDDHTSAGDIKFEDLNRDGKIDERDRTVIGSPHPNVVYQFTAGLVYEDFDISLFFDGSQGNEVFNLNETWSQASGGWLNRSTEMANRWSLDNEVGSLPRVHILDPNQNSRPHSGMLENAGYFRINKIDFGYKFSGWRSEKSTRIYLSVQNLAIFTNFREGTGFHTNSYAGPGVLYGVFPASATLLAGIQLGI